MSSPILHKLSCRLNRNFNEDIKLIKPTGCEPNSLVTGYLDKELRREFPDTIKNHDDFKAWVKNSKLNASIGV